MAPRIPRDEATTRSIRALEQATGTTARGARQAPMSPVPDVIRAQSSQRGSGHSAAVEWFRRARQGSIGYIEINDGDPIPDYVGVGWIIRVIGGSCPQMGSAVVRFGEAADNTPGLPAWINGHFGSSAIDFGGPSWEPSSLSGYVNVVGSTPLLSEDDSTYLSMNHTGAQFDFGSTLGLIFRSQLTDSEPFIPLDATNIQARLVIRARNTLSNGFFAFAESIDTAIEIAAISVGPSTADFVTYTGPPSTYVQGWLGTDAFFAFNTGTQASGRGTFDVSYAAVLFTWDGGSERFDVMTTDGPVPWACDHGEDGEAFQQMTTDGPFTVCPDPSIHTGIESGGRLEVMTTDGRRTVGCLIRPE